MRKRDLTPSPSFRIINLIFTGMLLWMTLLITSCSTVVKVTGTLEDTIGATESKIAKEAEKRKWKPVRRDPAAPEYQRIQEERRDRALHNLIARSGLPDYIRVEDGVISHLAYLQSGTIYTISRLDSPSSKIAPQHYTAYRNLPDSLFKAFTVATLPEKRLALVIGNAAYSSEIGRLTQPVNDARAMKSPLERLGFEVMVCENCTRSRMRQMLQRFGRQLASYKVRLVYYSGHGLQCEGKNYLLPVNARLKTVYDVRHEAVGLQEIFDVMHTIVNVTNIVMLDACRNNPFGGVEKGLAEVRAPRNVLVSYATAPGRVALEAEDADHSFYTEALLHHIETPNISISEMLGRVRSEVLRETRTQQMPWETTSLIKPFYFIRY